MKRKLKSSRGESIAESLISILIVALAAVMFAGMVTASSQVIETSTDWMDRYYAAVSAINNQQTLVVDGVERVKRQGDIHIIIDGNQKDEKVTAFINEDMGRDVSIVSYIKQTS